MAGAEDDAGRSYCLRCGRLGRAAQGWCSHCGGRLRLGGSTGFESEGPPKAPFVVLALLLVAGVLSLPLLTPDRDFAGSPIPRLEPPDSPSFADEGNGEEDDGQRPDDGGSDGLAGAEGLDSDGADELELASMPRLFPSAGAVRFGGGSGGDFVGEDGAPGPGDGVGDGDGGDGDGLGGSFTDVADVPRLAPIDGLSASTRFGDGDGGEDSDDDGSAGSDDGSAGSDDDGGSSDDRTLASDAGDGVFDFDRRRGGYTTLLASADSRARALETACMAVRLRLFAGVLDVSDVDQLDEGVTAY